MTNILTAEERTQIVNSHIRNLAMNQYNLQVSIIEEKAKSAPDQNIINDLTSSSSSVDKQIAALNAEIASIASENVAASN